MKNYHATMLGVDINHFSTHTSEEQLRLRHRLYAPLLAATAQIERSRIFLDEGDGGVVIMPSRVTAEHLATDLIPSLVRDVNQSGEAPMRLRFMIHRGEVNKDRWGWTGSGLALVFRTLQSERLKQYHNRIAKSLAIIAMSSQMYSETPDDTWDALMIRNKETRALIWAAPVEAT